MYTIKESTDILGVSKVTVYKHMEKTGIKKGKKLTNEDLSILRESIIKSKGKEFTRKVLTSKDSEELTILKNKLEKTKKECAEVQRMNENLQGKIVALEKDNRELIAQLQNSQIMSNELIAQNIELVRETRLLLAPVQEEKQEERQEEKQEEKQSGRKKWWKL